MFYMELLVLVVEVSCLKVHCFTQTYLEFSLANQLMLSLKFTISVFFYLALKMGRNSQISICTKVVFARHLFVEFHGTYRVSGRIINSYF